MKKKFLQGVFLLAFIGCGAIAIPVASASAEWIKLPYASGQEFVVVQGYNSPPTHIKKDADAIDFSQNGCDAYGKIAVAASAGVVVLAEENGYNGGYGTQLLIDEGNHVIARYAHLIPGTIPFPVGASVSQGQPVGAIGDTGLVAGAACPAHPGTHIHFALYYQNPDGSFAAYLPEPISNYTQITAGRWYLSDNGGISNISGVRTVTSTSASSVTTITATTTIAAPGGGVSALPVAVVQSVASTSSTDLSVAPTTTFASFNSTTLAIDLSWQSTEEASGSANATDTPIYSIYKIDPANASDTIQIATTTGTTFSYPLLNFDFGGNDQFEIEAIDSLGNQSTLGIATADIPSWFTTIQSVDTENSNSSWYGDNWYNLGTGFYGLIRSLTLEGFIDRSDYGKSHLYLDEYLDSDYAQLNQTFTISDNAPFTDGLQKVTINDLNIPLQPNKYYRLRTYQDFQNESVILAGSSATGTAMWNEFILGQGRIENQYRFFPYLSAVVIPDYPPLQPPDPPPLITPSFDSLNSILDFSWSPATDPDTTSSLLTYEWNISTSTSFDPAGWQAVGKTFSASAPVISGNSYEVGVRAVDDLGNVGTPAVEPWNFPPGYVTVPKQLDHSFGLPTGGAQKIVFPATTTVSGIALWTSVGGGSYCCSESFVSIHSDVSGTMGDVIATSNSILISYLGPAAERMYSFGTPPTLPAGAYWFSLDNGPDYFWDVTNIAGSTGDAYPDGEWSAAPQQDAYFRIAE